MGKYGKPVLYDPAPLIQAGIERALKASKAGKGKFSELIMPAFRKAIRIKDEQNAVMRYKWYNLPGQITGELIERMLYYRGQLAFAKLDDVLDVFKGRWVMLPYTLQGTGEYPSALDEYARYKTIRLLPVAGTEVIELEGGVKKQSPLSILLSEKTFEVQYDVVDHALTPEMQSGYAVILKDYTSQIAETNIPRADINDPICELEAHCFAYANTSMMNATGVMGMRVNIEDEKGNVDDANSSVEEAALTGKKYIPIVGSVDFQDLAPGAIDKPDEFMVMAQAVDNFRLSTYGIENGGLYQKKTYVNDGQSQMNGGQPQDIYHNGLELRQKFCDIVNSIWGLGIWCEAAEYHSGVDMDGDGTTDDNIDQSGTAEGDQPVGGEE